jgi:hypothetical protein
MRTVIGSRKSKKLPKKILELAKLFAYAGIYHKSLSHVMIDKHGNAKLVIAISYIVNLFYRLDKKQLKERTNKTLKEIAEQYNKLLKPRPRPNWMNQLSLRK